MHFGQDACAAPITTPLFPTNWPNCRSAKQQKCFFKKDNRFGTNIEGVDTEGKDNGTEAAESSGTVNT